MGKIRSITVGFNSDGVGRLSGDIDKLKAKVRDFGSATREAGGHTRARSIAASAGLRAMEGNFQQNIRAVERFTSVTLGLGPLFNAAFPIVGGIAFGAMIVGLGKKVNEFFRDIREAPQRINMAFSSANAGLRLTNDELKGANDRLENDIAKLEGKRQNQLKLALDEAIGSADKLAQSLDKDLEALHKLVAEDSRNWFQRLVGSEGEFGEEIKKFRADIQDITNRGTVSLAAAGTDPTKQRMAREDTRDELYIRYNQQIAATQTRLAAATPHQGPQY